MGKMFLQSGDHRFALGGSQSSEEMFHDARVGIHGDHSRDVLVAPGAKEQARRVEHWPGQDHRNILTEFAGLGAATIQSR